MQQSSKQLTEKRPSWLRHHGFGHDICRSTDYTPCPAASVRATRRMWTRRMWTRSEASHIRSA